MAATALSVEGRASPGASQEHPRTLGWFGTAALAMGGSNQSLFLIAGLMAANGSAAVPLLAGGLVLSYMAMPGWIELILMWPRRVGGIAATCAEAFRPYSPVLANLTGVSYWWGWVPTCGLTAILSASALHQWYLPQVPVTPLALTIVVLFAALNMCGVWWVVRVAKPVALASAGLAFLSCIVPVVAGSVDWRQALSFHLESPFQGPFGAITSAMAGLYLIGFAAPAFEAAACHVGETKDPVRNVPRAMYAAAGMASVYFVALPVVWLGVFGSPALEGDLANTLGPTFAPLVGGAAKSAAVWFMVLNMFHGTMQPLAGAARTLSQLSDDGLLPRTLGRRTRRDVPWVATWLTAGMASLFLLTGDPPWVIAAANFCYLIGIGMPSVAVWLLRRHAPEMPRPYRARRGWVGAGLLAGFVWLLSTFLGLGQFNLPTVIASLALAYAGAALYAGRRIADRRRSGAPRLAYSLHLKLTGAMLAVMVLDGAGYLIAVQQADVTHPASIAVLKDIFVAVAILTVTVGLVLPGMIAHAAEEVSRGAQRLARGTVADLTRAMEALARGDLEAAHARAEVEPVTVTSRDEVGAMATAFNAMQDDVQRAARALDGAREGIRATEDKLERNVARQAAVALLGRLALEGGDLAHLLRDVAATVRSVLDVDVATVAEHGGDEHSVRARAGTPPAGGCGGQAGAPIAGRGRDYGVLEVATARPREFARDELEFLQATAHVVAEAVERLRSEQGVRHRALHDAVTGLPNRALLVDRLKLALGQSLRRQRLVAVLFLDVDNFKLINDTLGHTAGDRLLATLAARLDETMRPGDTVARFGGDEFVMVCDDLRDAGAAVAIAERAAATLDAPFTLAGAEHYASASIGIALGDSPADDAEELIADADAAMYRAKERGRGRFEMYDETMRARAVARLQVENELHRALERDELRLHYQPVVALVDGSVVGVEALVRWEHPERGLVPPADFIDVAEDSGLVVPLGRWVLGEACRCVAAWHSEREEDAPLRLSVNLSPRQMVQRGLIDAVEDALSLSGLDPACLQLEITEGVLMEDSEAAVETLARLKALGVAIVLDDFGTGYSSLAYVQRFPIDTLKIDRTFIQRLGGPEEDPTIVEAIVNMARGLRVDVVAEGVDTAAQARALRALGCNYAQGFYYARPAPAEEVAPLLDLRLPLALERLSEGAGA